LPAQADVIIPPRYETDQFRCETVLMTLHGKWHQIMRRAKLLGMIVTALVMLSAGALGGIALVVSAPSEAPPPLRTEKHGSAPFQKAVWIDGHWVWSGGHYVWQGGHWERVRPGARAWQQGAWSRKGDGWFWTPGRWL